MIIDISLHVLLQAAHTFCVSVLRVHVVLCVYVLSMCVRARVCVYLRSIYIYNDIYLMLIIDLFLGLLVFISTWFV